MFIPIMFPAEFGLWYIVVLKIDMQRVTRAENSFGCEGRFVSVFVFEHVFGCVVGKGAKMYLGGGREIYDFS